MRQPSATEWGHAKSDYPPDQIERIKSRWVGDWFHVGLEECDLCHNELGLLRVTFTGKQFLCARCGENFFARGS